MLCVYFSAIVVRIVYFPFGLCGSAAAVFRISGKGNVFANVGKLYNCDWIVACFPAFRRSTRNFVALSLFWANFQIDQEPIRCSRPRRPFGPAGIGQIHRLSENGRCRDSGERVAEMAFRMSEAVPE